MANTIKQKTLVILRKAYEDGSIDIYGVIPNDHKDYNVLMRYVGTTQSRYVKLTEDQYQQSLEKQKQIIFSDDIKYTKYVSRITLLNEEKILNSLKSKINENVKSLSEGLTTIEKLKSGCSLELKPILSKEEWGNSEAEKFTSNSVHNPVFDIFYNTDIKLKELYKDTNIDVFKEGITKICVIDFTE